MILVRLLFIPVKMTSYPKALERICKKVHQIAIEAKNFAGWDR